jgi:transcriptional regulator with XRE-family HTH domain
MTQEDVAFAMDIAVRHYQKLEAGTLNVTLRTLVKASNALQLELRDLF